MKPYYLVNLSLMIALLALAGVSCRSQADGETNGVNQSGTLYGSEEKDGYAENLQIKIDDLAVHIGKMKESRAFVSADAQASFDASMAELETTFASFRESFEGFKDSAAESFMAEREKLNNNLASIEDLYLKIITDYELKF